MRPIYKIREFGAVGDPTQSDPGPLFRYLVQRYKDDAETSWTWEFLRNMGSDSSMHIQTYWDARTTLDPKTYIPHPMPGDTITSFSGYPDSPRYIVTGTRSGIPHEFDTSFFNMAHMQDDIRAFWAHNQKQCPHPISGGQREVDKHFEAWANTMVANEWGKGF